MNTHYITKPNIQLIEKNGESFIENLYNSKKVFKNTSTVVSTKKEYFAFTRK